MATKTGSTLYLVTYDVHVTCIANIFQAGSGWYCVGVCVWCLFS